MPVPSPEARPREVAVLTGVVLLEAMGGGFTWGAALLSV